MLHFIHKEVQVFLTSVTASVTPEKNVHTPVVLNLQGIYIADLPGEMFQVLQLV